MCSLHSTHSYQRSNPSCIPLLQVPFLLLPQYIIGQPSLSLYFLPDIILLFSQKAYIWQCWIRPNMFPHPLINWYYPNLLSNILIFLFYPILYCTYFSNSNLMLMFIGRPNIQLYYRPHYHPIDFPLQLGRDFIIPQHPSCTTPL